MEFNPEQFLSMPEALDRAKEDKQNISLDKCCKYPLKCLNDFLFGILPSELIVIGADTGVGKTQLANDLVLYNGLQGKRVYLFSLEGDKNEVVNRWKWQIICQEYFNNKFHNPWKEMFYPLYTMNAIDGLEEFEEIADQSLRALNDNVSIFNRQITFDVNLMTQQMDLIKDKADLVVIDHLHYFSMSDERSEQQEITYIMRRIKDLTEQFRVPVVLISHLRKKTKDRGIGNVEDFMGSSNIPKVASTALIFGNIYSHNKDNKYATAIRVCKNRAGMKADIGFQVFFDIQKRAYDDEYSLLKIDQFNQVEVLEEEDYPNWCKSLIKRGQDER